MTHFAVFYIFCVAINALLNPYNLISELFAHCTCDMFFYIMYDMPFVLPVRQ